MKIRNTIFLLLGVLLLLTACSQKDPTETQKGTAAETPSETAAESSSVSAESSEAAEKTSLLPSELKGDIYYPSTLIFKQVIPSETLFALEDDTFYCFDRYSGKWNEIGKAEPVTLTEENFDNRLKVSPWPDMYKPKDYRENNIKALAVKDGEQEYFILFENDTINSLGAFLVSWCSDKAEWVRHIIPRTNRTYTETLFANDGAAIQPYLILDYFERTFTMAVPKTNCNLKGSLSYDAEQNLILESEKGSRYTLKPDNEGCVLLNKDEKDEMTGLEPECPFKEQAYGDASRPVEEISGKIGDHGEFRVMVLRGITSGMTTFFLAADGAETDYQTLFSLQGVDELPKLSVENGEVTVQLNISGQNVPCHIRIEGEALELFDAEGKTLENGIK